MPKINKALGRITVKGDATSLNYGSMIYVTGVHVNSGVSINTSIPVGMAQAVDTIEFAGFINKDSSTKLLDSLPINFPKEKYLLAYRTFDQNGNALEVTGNEVSGTDKKLTFISDNVLLIDPSSFVNPATGVYTIDGVEYSVVTIEPGQYVDKGGEVNITAIANKTGQKTVKNFTVGSAGQLQSLSLDTPAGVVADGDQWVKIPYTAKDVDGKSIKNYETIVRSSNTLNLTSTEGTLYVKEESDGTAGIYWCDDSTKATNFANAASEDGVDRSVSLGTMVIGGESNMMILQVSDARRPVAFKSIKLNSDNNNIIAAGNTASIAFYRTNSYDGLDEKDEVIYLDQYGSELRSARDHDHAIIKNYFTNETKGKKHAIKVKADANRASLKADMPAAGEIFTGAAPVALDLTAVNAGDAAVTTTFKFSIVTIDANSSNATKANADNWDNVDNEKNIAFTVVPLKKLTGFAISKMGKQEIVTANSAQANGDTVTVKDSLSALASGALTVVSRSLFPHNSDKTDTKSNQFSVTGDYEGKTITIPFSAYSMATGSAFTITDDKLTAINPEVASSAALKWGDLYDVNTAKLTRRDAVKELKLAINTGESLEPVSQKVTLSDAEAVATDIRFYKDWKQYDAKDATFLPVDTEIKLQQDGVFDPIYEPNQMAKMGIGMYTNFQVHVFDQYGKVFLKNETEDASNVTFDGVDKGEYIEYTVSDIKESTSEFAHLANSFKVSQNGSTYNKLKITGAELGDTYTLTATIPKTTVSKSVKITVGADTKAYVSKGVDSSDSDEDFRKDKLNYKK